METTGKNETLENQILAQREYLLTSAKKILKNSHDAEDVVQETLIRALNFQNKFDGRYLRSWLFTILKRLCINRYHKDCRDRDNILKLKHIPAYNDVSSSTEDGINTSHAFEYVQKAIEELPENFGAVAQEVLMNNLSYQETADKLHIPLGTVMSRLYRARLLLKVSLLDGEGD